MSRADLARDRRAEAWLMERHGPDWYIGNATSAGWKAAYAAADEAESDAACIDGSEAPR